MKIVYIENYKKFNLTDLTVALGYFDGFHIAHRKILNKTLEIASNTNTKSAVLTFDRSVYDYIHNIKSTHLTSFQDKADIVMNLGFDYIIQIELTKDFINLDYQSFIDTFLKPQKNIVCGFDYTFGNMGIGNVEILKKQIKNTFVIDCEKYENRKIGTRYIKELLNNGEIEKANLLLEKNYRIKGTLAKRNKFYSISGQEYHLVKSGIYDISINTLNKTYNFEVKIKKDEENNLLIIKNSLIGIDELENNTSISVEIIFNKEGCKEN